MRLIDADVFLTLFRDGTEGYDCATYTRYEIGEILETEAPTVNAIPIPENATNGDMIKALFPTADISLNDSCFEGVVNKYGFDMKWWNAPYKAESEDKE